MADIHILPDHGEAIAYPEERIPELLRNGDLSPAALYWREGMADWEPLDTFRLPVRSSARPTEPVPLPTLAAASAVSAGHPPLSRPESQRIAPSSRPLPEIRVPASRYPASSSPPRPPSRPRYRFRRNPWPLTILLELALAGCLVIAGLELVQGTHELQQVSAAPAPPMPVMQALSYSWNGTGTPPNLDPANPTVADASSDEQNAVFTTGQVLEWSGWAANGVLLALYFLWLYRTMINCRHLSSITRLKPAGVIGMYFIPFLNLFRPCQDLQEIWRVSGNPRTWLNDRGSILVGVWWTLALVTLGVSIETLTLFETIQTRSDEVVAWLFFVVLKTIQAAWYVTFLLVTGLVIRRQARVIAQSRQRSEPATAR